MGEKPATKDLAARETESGYQPSQMSRWFRADTRAPRAVVLLIHGLNQKPSSWQALTEALNAWDIHVFRLTLRGHGGAAFENMKPVTMADWRQDFMDGAAELAKAYPGVKKVLIAYSLGGLVSQETQLALGEQVFDAQILMAPSLRLKPYVHLMKPMARFVPAIPSRTPRDYRANSPSTASAAYLALFGLLASFRSFDCLDTINVNTLVLMHKDDEVVSYKGIHRMIGRYGLDRWQMVPVEAHNSRLEADFKHMIIDPHSLGDRGWAFLTRAIARFVSNL
ncbi:MAG TPA: hypothetical protein DHV36_09780 [Desulfobacteraceae bacterium]|nr:hypothetical protein [Desulfobacteraceae bacterium]